MSRTTITNRIAARALAARLVAACLTVGCLVLCVVPAGLLPDGLTAASPASAAGTSVTYTVRSGDSPQGIADRYGVALADLLTANKLRLSAVIQPGQRLVVPGVVLPTSLPPRLPGDIVWVPARLRLLPVFQAEAARYKLPADLLMAVAYTESAWRATIVSSAGAIGIGQLLPSTARWVATDLIGLPRLDPRNPADNIRMSARYLRWLLDRWPTEKLALAAYFEGGTTVSKAGPSRGAQRYARIIESRRPLFRW